MKACTKCNEEKPESAFYYNKSKDKLDSHCKDCQREYRKQHYRSNKKYYKDKAKRNWQPIIDDNQRKIKKLLQSSSCKDCGEKNWLVLEFDHLPQFTKSFNISTGMKNFRWEKVLTEIKKCDIVCANCHRLRTQKRSNNWRLD